MDVYQMIKNQREKLGLTQKEVAEMAGLETSVYIEYEKKERQMYVDVFFEIAYVLNIDISFIPSVSEKEKTIENDSETDEEVDEDVKRYYEDISQYPVLSNEEERRLIQGFANGDEEAKKTLAQCNLRLVYEIAENYKKRGLSFMDVIHEGNVGLLKAIDRYDGSKGFKFSTYATWWIKQYITRAISEQSKLIRIPTNDFVSPIYKIKKAYRKLTEELGREPSAKELAEKLGMDEETIKKILDWDS